MNTTGTGIRLQFYYDCLFVCMIVVDHQSMTYLAIKDHDALIKVMMLHGGCRIKLCQRRFHPETMKEQ